MSTNTDLAKIFHAMATILEIKGANAFKINAHSKVARVLEDMVEDIASIEDLSSISGIGKSSAKKIEQYINTGTIVEYDELLASIPSGLLEVMNVQGLGPKKVRQLWQEADVVDLQTLRQAIQDGRLDGLPRMGAKTIQNITEALAFVESTADRTRIGIALPMAEDIISTLEKLEGITKITYAGSLRRGKETIGDIDILACTTIKSLLVETFCSLPHVAKIQSQGDTKCSVRLNTGMQVDLRIVDQNAFGAALMYFTGSKEHNILLRERANKQDCKLNEYGLYSKEQNVLIASETEEAIYASLSLPWLPPEIREGRDECTCDETPALISQLDIRCDLHCHTTASDGHMSIEELSMHAISRGFHTIAVTDHSQSQGQANGLKPERLVQHIQTIREANESVHEITILAGSEVDILPDGSLDYKDEILKMLDVVVASPHAALKQSTDEATKRILKAIEHPLVHIIGHPTGRIINTRKGLELDIPTLVAAAAQHNTALEINAHHLRLDLRDTHVRAAVEANALISINTDAHTPENFDQIRYGIFTARRGWLTPKSCINCLEHGALQTWLQRNC